MKKAILKRTLAFFCAAAVFATSVLHPVDTQAATSAKTVTNAYVTYLKKQIASCKYPEDVSYQLYDFNKDGVKELVVASYNGGARATYDVYTYYKKKVVKLVTGESDINYIKGKKYIVGHGSGGVSYNSITLYQIKNGKVKKVETYLKRWNNYTLNGKKISSTRFYNMFKKMNDSLGKSYTIQKSYTTPKKVGFSVLPSSTKKKEIAVKKIANGKIYYYEYKTGEAGLTTWKSKTKTAKITSATKFYYGDTTQVYKGNRNVNEDNRKWVYSISKAQFMDKMATYYGGSDYIQVKNGKVVKVAIHIRIAG
ncbi:MAG: hypothetical protein MR425_06830 [Lachnospiraceae bacterium]|nr:hypothetical protein [Lachnospiraceae bacterium]